MNIRLTRVVPCNIPTSQLYHLFWLKYHHQSEKNSLWQFGDLLRWGHHDPEIKNICSSHIQKRSSDPSIFANNKGVDQCTHDIPIIKSSSFRPDLPCAPWPRSAGSFWSAPPEAPKGLPWSHRVACAPALCGAWDGAGLTSQCGHEVEFICIYNSILCIYIIYIYTIHTYIHISIYR